jgi:hypothetical protein
MRSGVSSAHAYATCHPIGSVAVGDTDIELVVVVVIAETVTVELDDGLMVDPGVLLDVLLTRADEVDMPIDVKEVFAVTVGDDTVVLVVVMFDPVEGSSTAMLVSSTLRAD